MKYKILMFYQKIILASDLGYIVSWFYTLINTISQYSVSSRIAKKEDYVAGGFAGD